MLYPIKIEFQEYPSGSWEDWSEYLTDVSNISLRVESDNPGEAGAIIFDSAKVSFRYEAGNPVYQKFSIDLTAVQRYLFRISILNTDNSYQIKFVGIADFSTIHWNEYENVIAFDIVDKLSALNLLTAEQCRDKFLIKNRLASSSPSSTGYEYQYHNGLPNAIWISGYHPEIYDDLNSLLVNPGEVIDIPEIVGGQSRLRVVTKSYLAISPNHGKVANYVEFVPYLDQTNFNVIRYESPEWLEHKAYNNLFYGIDINKIVSGELINLDGFQIIKALYNQAWPGTNLILKPSNLVFNVPAEYAIRLVENNPFGKTPFEAFITLINSIKPSAGELSGCYIYVDDNDKLVIQSRQYLTSGVQRSLGTTKVIDMKRRYFWDKIVDGVTVNLKTWIVDTNTGNYIETKGTATLKPPGATGFIKPKNEIKKDIITIEYPEANEDPKIFFAQKALEQAQDILNFYGKRRESIEFILDLDNNTINWNILNYLTISGKNYFFTKIDINTLSREISIEAVDVNGYNYDPRLVIFPLNDTDHHSTSDYIAQYSGGIIGGGGGSYNFLQPLELIDGLVKLNYTDNFQLTDYKLDTAQPIKTTDTPTFNQINLSTDGTTTQAVRGGRTISTSAPLTGGGDLTTDRALALSYNSTNLKLTSNALNTIQDIATTSTPTFAQVILSNAGTSTQAVRGDRSIATSYPLTGGGDLTANRTLALSYNATNLKLTSNALNTIQDIGITSSPTFNNLTLSGVITVNGTGLNFFAGDVKQSGNKKFYNNFISGWTGSGWQLEYGLTTASKSTLEVDNIWVRGRMNVYELVINQIRATNGSLFVSSAAKVKSVSGGTIGDVAITFEDPTGHNLLPFAIGDILLMQRVNISGNTIVKRIALRVMGISNTTAECNYLYQAPPLAIPAVGDDFVRIGSYSDSNRQGSVYITADDVTAPYIDIIDGITRWSDWGSASKTKVRLGKLTGITDANFGALSGYGLYSNNVYLTGKIFTVAGGNLAGWNINATDLTSPTITDGAGNDVNLQLVADSGAEAIGAYLNYDIQANSTPFFLSFGNIKDGGGNYTGRYGISFRQGSSTLFELSNNTTEIAGWVFDSQKFYKGTDVELNSSTKSIGVNSNKVKLFYTNTSNWGIEGRDGSNNLVFQLGSTNKIANWTFINEHIYKLQSGTPTSSPSYGLTISSTSTASVVIAYGSNYQRYVKFGYQTSGNWFGLEGTDANANIIFQLGTTNKIAGWNFDSSKFSTTDVRLESSANLSGLAVSKTINSQSVDIIKIGKFTTPSYDTFSSNINWTPSYVKNPSWGSASFTMTQNGVTGSPQYAFFSNNAGQTLVTFTWLITDDNIKNRFVRIELNQPTWGSGGYMPAVSYSLYDSNILVYDTNDYALFYYKKHLMKSNQLKVQIVLTANTGYVNYNIPQSISFSYRIVYDSTPITQVNDSLFRIYDSGGEREFVYDSSGIKLKGGFAIGSWLVYQNQLNNVLEFYYNGTLKAGLDTDGIWNTY